jgi:hypothetical protein
MPADHLENARYWKLRPVRIREAARGGAAKRTSFFAHLATITATIE